MLDEFDYSVNSLPYPRGGSLVSPALGQVRLLL
jgi:hypothetical protein